MPSPLFQPLTDQQFHDFATLITSHLGIQLPPSKKIMLSARISRRACELGFTDVSQYHAWFFSHPSITKQELPNLFNYVTTNKTFFLREPSHFDFLVQNFLPSWINNHPNSTLHLWSAGCSTGEEPYSLAMVLAASQANHNFNFSILATDISTRTLQKAKLATYDQNQISQLPPLWRRKFLIPLTTTNGTTYKIHPQIQNKVRLASLNLLSPNYGLPHKFHVIFLRNVLIYFNQDTQHLILLKILNYLHLDGLLFIGLSESIKGLPLHLTEIAPSIYKKTQNH